MPHFGLIDERTLGPEKGPLMRARLHMRGGKRRLGLGKISLGVITLYDALESAMQWYVASPDRRKKLKTGGHEMTAEGKVLYDMLVESGVLDGSFDFHAFDALVEEALTRELRDYDYSELLKGLDSVMTQLGVMPFDEHALPPEDPAVL